MLIYFSYCLLLLLLLLLLLPPPPLLQPLYSARTEQQQQHQEGRQSVSQSTPTITLYPVILRSCASSYRPINAPEAGRYRPRILAAYKHARAPPWHTFSPLPPPPSSHHLTLFIFSHFCFPLVPCIFGTCHVSIVPLGRFRGCISSCLISMHLPTDSTGAQRVLYGCISCAAAPLFQHVFYLFTQIWISGRVFGGSEREPAGGVKNEGRGEKACRFIRET